ncbi:hypothetical protein AAKU58_000481 [Oxalobacteraceae bacterium GrIS 1.18]
MKFRIQFCLIAAFLATTAQAQEAAPPAANTPAAPASDAAVRNALGKQDTDVDQTKQILTQTLTAVDKDYTLIKKGDYQVTYDMNYSYFGQQTINTDLASGTATLFSIENTNSHALTNTFSLDYGVLNNLTGNFTIPIVSKYSQDATFNGVSNGFGDLSFGARYQPFEAQRDKPSLTFTSRISVPTGTSPFKVVAGSGLATGSGVTGLTGGLNLNQIVDPVALFGSVNLTYNLPAKGLNQALGTSILKEVKPGLAFGFGGGFAYALSYMITTSVSFQETISAGSKLNFANGNSATTATQTQGIVSFGLGYRVSPKTTINTSLGLGLTSNSPNFTLDITIPFAM